MQAYHQQQQRTKARYRSTHLKDEDPLKGAVVGAISSGIGYIGGRIFQGPLEKLYNPISKQYE
ncbi:hypothetical protein [Candidatus Schmidhempelia bombi]|uniref:YtxH domain-containing protein n=1 Tax=Candidatus Schmidhempelia bombi str. Bimp TaxID=1387197 RepID=A0AB94IBS4_9GAMM|nr:hypothetical protein [Candidatus Schmidhempelia bombi]TEA26856.1 hypothetical protein O970_06780 [Candidatus Schmidhempelia bombi str. Bimp]